MARLNLHLKVKRLQDELMEKNVELQRLSSVDTLTGLRTRRYVFDRLNLEFLRARRYGSPLSLVMADLDHFKALNDEFGHPGGDAVLRETCELLMSSLRATDVAGRYGGEEIIVLMPQNDLAGASMMGERWREAIEAHEFTVPDGRRARVTVSIGVACFLPEMETPEALITAADDVLYLAKEKGRNRLETA